MLIQLQTGPGGKPAVASLADALRAGDGGDAIALLLGCHTRIRHFAELAVRLTEPEAPEAQVAVAAAAVRRYYTVALPLHEADENESVYPRLRHRLGQRPAWRAMADANQAMVDQHFAIDAILAALLPRWAEIERQPALRQVSRGDALRLRNAWAEHLELEETIVFPALRSCLEEQDRADIRREMAERRKLA